MSDVTCSPSLSPLVPPMSGDHLLVTTPCAGAACVSSRCHWPLPSLAWSQSAINPSQARGTGFHQLMDGADNNILANTH